MAEVLESGECSSASNDVCTLETSEDTENVKDFDVEIFIELLQKYECLWNTSLASYKDRNCKMNAWQQLAIIFGKDVEFLKQEFKKLKDNLKKCLDRREKATRSGAPYSKLPQCKYYNQLLFLTDKTANKPTESNISIGRNENESSEVDSESLEPTSLSTPAKKKASPQNPLNDSNFVSQPLQEAQTPSKKSKPSPEGFIGQPRKSRAELSQVVDSMLAKTLFDKQKKEEAGNADSQHSQDDEDSLYHRSLVPIFKQLPLKKKRLAKVKIDQLLYNIEFETENIIKKCHKVT